MGSVMEIFPFCIAIQKGGFKSIHKRIYMISTLLFHTAFTSAH